MGTSIRSPPNEQGPACDAIRKRGPAFVRYGESGNLVSVPNFPVPKTLKTRSGVTSELTTVQADFSFGVQALKRSENSIFSPRFPLQRRNTSAVPVVYAYS